MNIGEKYNRLTAKAFHHKDERSRNWWVFQCDCGNETITHTGSVRSGNTKSCGCLIKDAAAKRRLPDNHEQVTAILLQYKRHARDRKIPFQLTREQINDLIRQPCYYCGVEAGNLKRTKNYPQGFPHNGIDRKENDKSYIKENCVPCCGTCNRAKGARNEKDVINWIQKIGAKFGTIRCI
jgi:hypothetical protein